VTTIMFVRHAESVWNRAGRWQGHADIPLSPCGSAQAHCLAARLQAEGRVVDHVYTSDLGRASQTAEIIAQALGMAVHPLTELRERDVGAWSGLTRQEIQEHFADEWAQIIDGADSRRGGHGETLAEVRLRLVQVVDRLVTQHPQSRLLVVSHAGAIRALLRHRPQQAGQSLDVQITNTAITEIVFDEPPPQVPRLNDIGHLTAVEHTS
jgi:broad specificity phosphatase PhoE